MGIIGAAFFPHPPIVLPEVGRGQERAASATVDGMAELAALVAVLKPEVIAVMTPHGPAFSDVIAVGSSTELTGTMEQFSAPQVSITKKVNIALMKAFLSGGGAGGCACGAAGRRSARPAEAEGQRSTTARLCRCISSRSCTRTIQYCTSRPAACRFESSFWPGRRCSRAAEKSGCQGAGAGQRRHVPQAEPYRPLWL